MKQYHFISGLPRSGSTLLVAILRQNPDFFAEISNPLADFMYRIVDVYSTQDPSHKDACPADRMKSALTGLIEGYYKDKPQRVMFNTHRVWTGMPEYLHELIPNFKIIVTVRDFADVLNSFESIYKKRGLIEATPLYGKNTYSVYTRTEYLANESFVRHAYDTLREVYFGPYKNHILFVEYTELATYPVHVMQQVYDFIEEPYFSHNFDDVTFSAPAYDHSLHTRNLHTIRPVVQYEPTEIVLPPDLYNKYKGWDFWRAHQ